MLSQNFISAWDFDTFDTFTFTFTTTSKKKRVSPRAARHETSPLSLTLLSFPQQNAKAVSLYAERERERDQKHNKSE